MATCFLSTFLCLLKKTKVGIVRGMEKKNVVYMLCCGDGSLYTGWTNNIEKRLATHQAGKGGKYTRSRLPVQLVYLEECASKQEAMRREWQIKQLTREEKLILTQNQGRQR